MSAITETQLIPIAPNTLVAVGTNEWPTTDQLNWLMDLNTKSIDPIFRLMRTNDTIVVSKIGIGVFRLLIFSQDR
jgi:hypothetical protein